jgi:hypothetical protein
MTRLTVDSSMKEKLTSSGLLTEVCDESGQTIGYFHPVRSQGGEEPITEEIRKWADEVISGDEIDEALNEPGGCTTEELIQELKQL